MTIMIFISRIQDRKPIDRVSTGSHYRATASTRSARKRVTTSRFDLAQVAAAFSLPLLLVAFAGWFSWSENWERAEGELLRTVDGAAEYAERLFASAYLAGRLADSLLAGATDQEIRQNEEYFHNLLAGVLPELPGSISINLSDREGQILITTLESPTPPVSVADREWFQALRTAAAPGAYVGALSVERVREGLFFSLSLPRLASGSDLPAGDFNGLFNVAFDPYAVAAELATTTHEGTDVISLVRSDGEILTTTRGLRHDIPRVPQTSRLFSAIGAGETRGLYEGRSLGLREGLAAGRGLQIAFRQVGELPVYATVSRSPAAIVAEWSGTMVWLLAVGLPTSLALGLLSLTAMRQKNALAASQAELNASFDSAATGTALIDGASGRILKANRRLLEMSDRDAAALNGMTLEQLLDRACDPRSGPEGAPEGLDRLQRPDGTVRWVECAAAPVTRTPGDTPALKIVTLHDVTERKEAEERQKLLAREVDHRAKNVLAIVQAVIRLARDPEAAPFADRIEGRVQALARAHELLARDRWQGTELGELLHDELAPYRDGARLVTDGRAVRVDAAAVQPLSMALHELATNAVKHGALGRPEGSLSVRWQQKDPDGRLELLWEERAAPTQTPDAQNRGAGLHILRGSVEQLGGTVSLDWRAGGLCCRIELPAGALVDTTPASDGKDESVRDAGVIDRASSLSGKRVLLVEDEIIVALDMTATLEDLGCEVIGPAASLPAAQALARQEAGRIDAALLDVNLKGATTLGLARELHELGVPCIFATGYSELPERAEEDWVLLRKPVGAGDVATALRAALAPAKSHLT